MPDTTSTSPYAAAGQVSLPNDGQILSTGEPDASEQNMTPAPATSGTSVAQQGQTQANPVVQPQANPAQQSQGGTQSQGGQPGNPAQPKQTTQGVPSTPIQPPVHPSVQKASILSQVAQALGGGPKYTYKVDPTTGEMEKTQVPVSRAHIGMAIALEALTGALAGLGAKGTNATGQAAAAGLEQGQKIKQERQQKDQQAQQQASKDYSNKMQIAETNLKMWSTARQVGRLDSDSVDAYVAPGRSQVDDLIKTNPSAILKAGVKYSDLPQWSITNHNALPYEKVPRLDKNGNQVEDSRGVPMWDINYAIIDPNFKKSGWYSPDEISTANKHNISGFDSPNIGDAAIEARMALNQKANIAQLSQMDDEFKRFEGVVNEGNENQTGYEGLKAPTLPKGTPEVQNAIDAAAAKYPNVPKEVIQGIANQESGGNPNVADGKAGEVGVMQVLPNTAAQFGVSADDLRNPATNIDTGARYLQSLLTGPAKGDLRTAIQMYNGSGAAAQNYAKQVSDAIGLDNAKLVKPIEPFNLDSIKDTVKNDQSFNQAEIGFQKYLNIADGNYTKAISLMSAQDPSGAAKIVRYLGGMDNVHKVDQVQAVKADTAKLNATNDAKLSYDEQKKDQENQGIIQRNENLISAIVAGKNIDLSRIATMRAYDRETIVNEILKRNPNFNPASIDRAIKLADEAADESKTGSLGNSIRNVNTAFGHMGEAMDALNSIQSKEGRNFSDYTNKPLSWMDDHFGKDTDYQRWKVALNAASTDWQNLLNNQHALTESDKKTANEVSNPNATFGNAVAALREMARTGAVRTLPLNQRWQETMHANYPNLIEPQTIDAIKKINDPIVNQYLGGLESGGDLVNGQYGVGNPGKKVSDLLGNTNQPQGQQKTPTQGLQGQRPNEVPYVRNGQVIGYTLPGQQGMRSVTPFAVPQSQ